MTQLDSPEEEQSELHVVLLVLNGDVAAATAALKTRFPRVTITNLPRPQADGDLIRQLRTLRARHPDVFAVFMESISWQRGQNVLKVFGSLSGAKRLVMMDASGGFTEEKRGPILLSAPKHLAHEVARSTLSVLNTRKRLSRLEKALTNLSSIPRTGLVFPPHILFLRATPGAGTKPGGAATHINGFVRTVREQQASVRMIANDRIAGLDQDVPLTIVSMEPTGLTRSAFDLHNNLVFTDGVLSQLGQDLPDLIYQRYSRFTFAGVEASFRSRRPLFLEYNGSEVWLGKHWDDAGMFSLLERFERLNLNAAARVFVVSQVERQNLLNSGICDEKIIVNPNGVDVETFQPGAGGAEVRASFHVEPQQTLVGFVGTFGPWHGVLELAKAITLVPRDLQIHFLLVGAGQLLEATKKIIEDAGLGDRVYVTGTVEHARVPGLLDACDILVSPHVPLADGSEFFGSPTKLFEYMAMGKGIVASRLGQIGDVLKHQETALLVEPGNADELCAAIVRLAESPTLREALGTAARRAAIEHHTWKRNAQNVLDAYQAWLNESK